MNVHRGHDGLSQLWSVEFLTLPFGDSGLLPLCSDKRHGRDNISDR